MPSSCQKARGGGAVLEKGWERMQTWQVSKSQFKELPLPPTHPRVRFS